MNRVLRMSKIEHWILELLSATKAILLSLPLMIMYIEGPIWQTSVCMIIAQ